ncbi:MAG: MFS transporter, partial [Chloroflexi bacterium]|nr:MFS transporter [Chloroflexota bacterium]
SLDLVQTWHLFLFAVVGGMAVALGEPPRQSLLAQSLPTEQLTNGNALAVAAANVTRSVGPFLGGYLIAYFGPDVNFYLQAAFHASVIPLALAVVMPPHSAQPASGGPPAPPSARSSAAAHLASGFRYVRRDRVVLGLILTAVVPLIFIWFFPAGLLPVFAEEVLGKGPEELGILVAMAGIGGFAGTLTLASGRRFRSTGKAVYATGAMSGLSMAVFSFMHWYPLAALVMFVVGAFQYAYITHQHALLLAVTQPEYRGRVTGILFMCLGLSPVAGLVAGGLASWLGADWALFIAGIFVAVSMFAIPALFPTLRQLTIKDEGLERKPAGV